MSILNYLNSVVDNKRPKTTTPSSPLNVTRHDPKPKGVVAHNGVKVVVPKVTSLLEQRGWSKKGNRYLGDFATAQGTFKGAIDRRGDVFKVWILKPPKEVRLHTKFPCFAERGKGWWSIHLQNNPCDKDPSAIIAYVERILSESFANAERRKK